MSLLSSSTTSSSTTGKEATEDNAAVARNDYLNDDNPERQNDRRCQKQLVNILATSSRAGIIRKNTCFDPDSDHHNSRDRTLRQELHRIWDDVCSKAMSLDLGLPPNDRMKIQQHSDQQQSNALTSHFTQWFSHVYNSHIGTGRFYHTPVHLKEMFDYLNVLQEECFQHKQNHYGDGSHDDDDESYWLVSVLTQDVWIVAIQFAIFFHDLVYDAKSSTNEEDSAIAFQQFTVRSHPDSQTRNKTGDKDEQSSSFLPNHIVDLIVTFIRATQKHALLPLPTLSTMCQVDEQEWHVAQSIFLDLDLSVLGKTKPAYMAYAGLIREEYVFVPRSVYYEKRSDILQLFLDGADATSIDSTSNTGAEEEEEEDNKSMKLTDETKPIYFSPVFRVALEDPARKNLSDEIQLLRNGTIPCERQPRSQQVL